MIRKEERPFGAELRRLRERRGTTQRQLAELSTVSVRAIRDLELGRTGRPRRETVRLIADGLRLTGRARAAFSAAATGRQSSDPGLPLLDELEPGPPPAPLGEMVGREIEVSVVEDLVGAGSQRLVTVSGLSGVGKTRLALEVAASVHRSTDLAVVWCGGARGQGGPLTREDVLGSLVLEGLGDDQDAGMEVVAALIGDRPCLMVVDDVPAGRWSVSGLIALLEGHRGLRVLVTAEAPLDVRGERCLPLPPLPVPGRQAQDEAEISAFSSVQFLVRAVRHSRPSFALSSTNAMGLAEVARRLDGIPCALDAAASWLAIDDPAALLGCLDEDPSAFIDAALGGLAGSLHRALAALARDEAAALARLIAAPPGWSMTQAARITGLGPVQCAQVVQRLLSRGLIRPADGEDPTRFQALGLLETLELVERPEGSLHAEAN